MKLEIKRLTDGRYFVAASEDGLLCPSVHSDEQTAVRAASGGLTRALCNRWWSRRRRELEG